VELCVVGCDRGTIYTWKWVSSGRKEGREAFCSLTSHRRFHAQRLGESRFNNESNRRLSLSKQKGMEERDKISLYCCLPLHNLSHSSLLVVLSAAHCADHPDHNAWLAIL